MAGLRLVAALLTPDQVCSRPAIGVDGAVRDLAARQGGHLADDVPSLVRDRLGGVAGRMRGGDHVGPGREPEARALVVFCQALLSSNRFLYVD